MLVYCQPYWLQIKRIETLKPPYSRYELITNLCWYDRIPRMHQPARILPFPSSAPIGADYCWWHRTPGRYGVQPTIRSPMVTRRGMLGMPPKNPRLGSQLMFITQVHHYESLLFAIINDSQQLCTVDHCQSTESTIIKHSIAIILNHC